MSEETLLTAARRMVRFFRIDEAAGGITTIETVKAMETLDLQVRKEEARQKQQAAEGVAQEGETANG